MILILVCMLMTSSQAEQVQTFAEENRAQGTIGIRIYAKYLTAGANIVVLLAVVLLNIMAQVHKDSPALVICLPHVSSVRISVEFHISHYITHFTCVI